MKRCRKCEKVKPARDFYERGDGKLMGSCKACHCAATSAKAPPAQVYRPDGVHGGRSLTPAELVVCPRCSLRGPHECIEAPSLRLGGQSWV